MNDGIHHVHDFMVVSDHIERMSPYYKGLPFDDTIMTIDRQAFETVLESHGAADSEFESAYTDYNAFGYSPAMHRWYAWYDNTK